MWPSPPPKKNISVQLTVWHQTKYRKNALLKSEYRKIDRTNIEKFTIDKTHNSPFWRSTKIDINDRWKAKKLHREYSSPDAREKRITNVRKPTKRQVNWPCDTRQDIDNSDLWMQRRWNKVAHNIMWGHTRIFHPET